MGSLSFLDPTSDEFGIGGWNPLVDPFGIGAYEGLYESTKYTFSEGGFEDVGKGLLDPAEDVGKGVEERTKLLASLNAQFIKEESTENIRRATLQYEDLRSQVVGIQASSGFLAAKGTSADYVAKMDKAFQAEIDYINKSTESRVDIALLEGVVQGDIAKSQERAQTIGIFGDVIGLF